MQNEAQEMILEKIQIYSFLSVVYSFLFHSFCGLDKKSLHKLPVLPTDGHSFTLRLDQEGSDFTCGSFMSFVT